MLVFIVMHYNEIRKYCKNCDKKLILKSNRDIQKKNFCSHKCSSYYIGIERKKNNPELIVKFIKAGQTKEVNKKKGRKKECHPNWKGGKRIHKCKICNKSFEVPIYRSERGYGKYCSKTCELELKKAQWVKISCLKCNKEFYDRKKKNRKFCSCSCRAIYNKSYLNGKDNFINGTIPSVSSKMENYFLDYLNIDKNDRQIVISCFKVDGLKNQNIYEFLGDYWHGNPEIFINPVDINKSLNKSFGELYTITFKRFEKLKILGYKIYYIWENDWKNFKKGIIDKPKIQLYL